MRGRGGKRGDWVWGGGRRLYVGLAHWLRKEGGNGEGECMAAITMMVHYSKTHALVRFIESGETNLLLCVRLDVTRYTFTWNTFELHIYLTRTQH